MMSRSLWRDFQEVFRGSAGTAVLLRPQMMERKNLIEKERPDIVFMDICMPEMNGLQMIAALNSQFPDLEVSVLTGYRDFEYAKEAIRLGVTRFLLKPSNMDELEEAIECMCANLNLAHFSRVFKKQVGVSANEYRNQVLGK